MRRKSIFGILLFFLFLYILPGCQSSTSTTLATEPTPILSQQNPDIRGVIQEVFPSGDQVRGIYIVGKKEIDTTYDRAVVAITENTHIFIQQGKRYLITSKYNLHVGQTVEVLFTGPVATPYPVQAVASEIVILNTPIAYPLSLPPTITKSPLYPYPSVITGQPLNSYPLSSETQQPRSVEVTPKPSAIPYPSPVPVSAAKLSTALKNIGIFLDELPFASEMVYVRKEYYGCQDSSNAGVTIYYNVINRTSDSIKSQYIELFDNKNMKHEQWTELAISGAPGNAWQTSAVYIPAINNLPQAALYVIFLEYEGLAAPEQSNHGTPHRNLIPKAEIHLWLSYQETDDKIIIPERQSTILRTCKNGWWEAINP